MIKLADTLAPMADFPAVMAEHTAFEDGETLQEKYETGQLGGGGGGYTQLSQAEYDALTDDEKMDGREYRTYDTGHIYKLGIEYGKDGVQISDNETVEDKTWSSKKTSDEIAKVETELKGNLGEIEEKIGNIDNLKLINLGENVDADNCKIAVGHINRVYGYCGYFTQNVPMKGYAEIRCYHYGSGIRQFIDYTSINPKTYTRFIQYDGKISTAWQELATMDKIALKQECFNQKVTLTDSNWKYKKIPFTKSYMNTPSVNVSCGDYLNIDFYSYWGCEAYIININNKGCTIRYRSSKASASEPLEVNIIVSVNGI